MKLAKEQHSMFDEMVKARRGDVYKESELAEEFIAYLRGENSAGRLGDHVAELGYAYTKQRMRGLHWGANSGQTVLFEPDAILTLGDDERIDMDSARAPHLVRHHQVLTSNHARQTARYAEKSDWLLQRIPDLYAFGCTLGEHERRSNAE